MAGAEGGAGYGQKLRHLAQHLILRALIGLPMLLPYRWRVPVFGWIAGRVIAPFAGWNKRVRENLARIMPDLPPKTVAALERQVPNNTGRTLIEIYSGGQFKDHVATSPILGVGLEQILDARKRCQGVILISGHFGNYDVPRAVLSSLGHPVAGFYWPMRNPYFNRHYVSRISQIGQPVFPRGRRGLAEMVTFLKKGGLVGMLIDQHMDHGAGLTFFGETAYSPLSAAELALKYDCLLVPIYGRRRADGLNFDLIVEAAIPHTTPVEMTQKLNDSLEAITRANLDQWFWIHRRWKVPPHLAAAAQTAPESAAHSTR